MTEHFDSLETRTPATRDQAVFTQLPSYIEHAIKHTSHYREHFKGVDPEAIRSRDALASLPLTRKADLIGLQQAQPPLGGLAAAQLSAMVRLFQSPGPIYEPQGEVGDHWRMARALFAAGVRAGELVHVGFSYHLTPGGWMADAAARALGCAVFPAGTGNTELQLAAMQQLQPTAYCGTPSLLKILIDKAIALKQKRLSVRHALVSGEACPAGLKAWFAEHGVAVFECYATAELGLIAYETIAREGLVVDEGVLLELVDPHTGQPVPPGETGEVAVTLFNPVYPLIRFATGDLSASLPGVSPCGRTNMRIKGWLGRADQTVKVRGMFVYPQQVAQVVARHQEITRARLVVLRHQHLDELSIHCETIYPSDELAQRVTNSVRDVCKLRADVVFSQPGALPDDGRLIDDQRHLH
ncbi:phenylacetate-CoA ligase [Chitinivorax tropicus]|uniref:Phenylacetate-CoA ligase n=1 Tax=Chitinivorax tropicus TaxID=714531 RepID=A0A840MR36_9PROT|nr:AMP-binding protein [Chitinivorax tropicus]MBB5017691.1 phenylacetate-CoA ligase [Chitinivorax tropicus]